MSRVTKIICDRCKKEIIPKEDRQCLWVIRIMSDNGAKVDRELCTECMNEFNGWFSHNPPDAYIDGMPEACINCSNHPSNGGSGNCNCMLGSMRQTTC